MKVPKEVPQTLLEFKTGHGAGNVGVSYYTANGEKEVQLITCGADGSTVLRDPISLQAIATHSKASEPCSTLAISPIYPVVTVAGSENAKVLTLPKLEYDSDVLSSTTLPLTALAYSPDGLRLAIAGNEGSVKLYDMKDAQIKSKFKVDGYVKGMAWDPEGKYIAVTQGDGCLLVFEDNNWAKPAVRKLRALRKVDVLHTARADVAWHPDGSLLLAPGNENDVVLYERLSWEVQENMGLSGGHQAPVTAIAPSPNGLYAATGAEDGSVCLWSGVGSVEVRVVARAKAGGAAGGVSAIKWHPSKNELVVADDKGQLAVWTAPMPEGLDSPWVSVDILEKQREDAATEAAAATKAGGKTQGDAHGEDAESLQDCIDEEEGEDVSMLIARATGAAQGVPALSAGGPPKPPPRPIIMGPPVPKQQEPIQPGATCGPDGDWVVGPRFLAYTQHGAITTRPVDDHHVVEVTWSDTRVHGGSRVPLLSDYAGITLGALGERGALYAAPPNKAEGSSGVLRYRPFDTWEGNVEWTAALPEGEAAACVAAGQSFVAAATTSGLLRVFGLAGSQTTIISLPGQPVALAAQGHQLAVVSHAGAPHTSTWSQNLSYAIYDVSTGTCTASGPLPLSASKPPKAVATTYITDTGVSLTWLAFSTEGLLVAGDSQGTLRARSPQWGGCWLPVWDGPKAAVEGNVMWPVALSLWSQDGGQLVAIRVTAAQPFPPVQPRPISAFCELKPPMAVLDGAGAALKDADAKLLVVTAVVEGARSRADLAVDAGARDDAEAEVMARLTDADRYLLTLTQAALKAEKHARALEHVSQLTSYRSLEGALKLANHHRATQLAERVTLLLAEREALNTAAAQGGGLVDAGAYTPVPHKGHGSGPRLPLAEAGNQGGGATTPAPASTGPPTGGGFTALKAAAAALADESGGKAVSGQGGENLKRKMAAAPGAGAAAAPTTTVANPFARKKTKA